MLYGAVFVLVVPWMVYWPMRLSSGPSDQTIQKPCTAPLTLMVQLRTRITRRTRIACRMAGSLDGRW